jgi:hypothetical protein
MNTNSEEDIRRRAQERKNRPGARARLVRLKEADRSFDDEFWQNLSGEERLGAVWQLVVDMRILRGEDEVEPRLLRHVQNIEYRRR